MLRLDQSDWILLVDRGFQKKEFDEEIPINIPFPVDRAIVSMNVLTGKPSWVKGGGVTQRWSRLLVPVEVSYFSLALSQPKKINLEPVENSVLWFWSHHWITDLQIVVEVRRFTE
jgi:hypothetical protein